jgi:outer membrane protein insertion porin family/translocation and assembly module TamA
VVFSFAGMKARHARYLRGGVALMLACACAAPVIAEQTYLRRVRFTGQHVLGAGEIRKVMSTKFPSRFSFLPFVPLPPFDRAVLDEDMGRIVNLYQSYGYYHARARYRLAEEGRRRVTAAVVLSEGRPTRIGTVRIDIVSNEEASVRKGLEAAVMLRRGAIFRIELYDRTKELMDRYLANNGYGNASLGGRIIIDQQNYLADIVFTVRSGPIQSFGPVTLTGNTYVRGQDILRELSFAKGARFSRDVLTVSQRNIYRMGLFNSVVLTPSTEAGRDVPVEIKVDERARRTLGLGLGYGSEDKVRAQATWTRRYLWERPRTLQASLRYSSLLLSGSLDLTQLYFIDRFSSIGVHAGYDREYYVSYSNERIAVQPRLGRTFGRAVEGFVSYNLEVNRPVSVSGEEAQAITATKPGEYYFISGLMTGLRYDTVKNNLNPLAGSMVSLYVEPAANLLGSKIDYLRVIAEGRLFSPLGGGNILATRLRFGNIDPLRMTRNIPIFKRFFSGGSNSVRGYAYQSLGPKDADGTPLGGDYLVEGNLELRYPLIGQFRGVVFLDGGNVYADRSEFRLDNLKYGTGIGVRYLTIVGPVRLDIAFPLDPFPELDFGRFTFYLSLGNAF